MKKRDSFLNADIARHQLSRNSSSSSGFRGRADVGRKARSTLFGALYRTRDGLLPDGHVAIAMDSAGANPGEPCDRITPHRRSAAKDPSAKTRHHVRANTRRRKQPLSRPCRGGGGTQNVWRVMP
jgi:hypothetical protein